MEVIVTIVSKLVYKLFMGRIQPTYRDYHPFTTDRYISYQQDIPVPAGSRQNLLTHRVDFPFYNEPSVRSGQGHVRQHLLCGFCWLSSRNEQ